MIETVKSVPLTFFSQAFYKRLVQQWAGIGFGFICLITLLGVTQTGVTMRAPIREGVEKVQEVLAALPDVTVKDHKLSINKPTPYVLKIFDTNESAKIPNKLVIDPDHSVSDVDALAKFMKKNNVFMLVTANKLVVVKEQGSGVEVDDLSALPDGTFTHDQWVSVGTIIAAWTFPIILVFCVIGGVIGKFIAVLFVAIIAKVISLMLTTKVEFDGAMRLAAAAGVPACVLAAILPVSFWIELAVWIAYVVFGLIAVQPKKTPAA